MAVAGVHEAIAESRRTPHPDAALDRARTRFARSMRTAQPADLPSLARIHVGSGTPGLLADIGERYLRQVYYRRLLDSPVGRAEVIELAGHVAGFVTWSPRSALLYRSIVAPLPTAAFLARAALRRPRVARDFIESALHVEREAADVDAEIVSLEVDPAFQGLGLGFFLLERAVDDLRAAGAPAIKARILDGHDAVEALYARLGFARGDAFRLHGRPWRLLIWRAGG
jgi:GNAT superfamily N-acetyltransferase